MKFVIRKACIVMKTTIILDERFKFVTFQKVTDRHSRKIFFWQVFKMSLRGCEMYVSLTTFLHVIILIANSGESGKCW